MLKTLLLLSLLGQIWGLHSPAGVSRRAVIQRSGASYLQPRLSEIGRSYASGGGRTSRTWGYPSALSVKKKAVEEEDDGTGDVDKPKRRVVRAKKETKAASDKEKKPSKAKAAAMKTTSKKKDAQMVDSLADGVDDLDDLDKLVESLRDPSSSKTGKDAKVSNVENELSMDDLDELVAAFGDLDPSSAGNSAKGAHKNKDKVTLPLNEGVDDLNDADLEQALAEIESGDMDVFKFLEESSTDKDTGAGKSDVEETKTKGKKEKDSKGKKAVLGESELAPEAVSVPVKDVKKGGKGVGKEEDEDEDEDESEYDEDDEDDSFTLSAGLSNDSTSTDKKTSKNNKNNRAGDTTKGNAKGKDPLVIDGKELNREEFDLGVEPPPLEEFKRLMESLEDQDSIFEDDDDMFEDTDSSNVFSGVDEDGQKWYGDATEGFYKSAITPARLEKPDTTARAWLPNVYEGGKPSRPGGTSKELLDYLNEHDEPSQWRVQITSVVTNSTSNSTALDIVNKVYDYIKKGTENDKRIEYQIICVTKHDTEEIARESGEKHADYMKRTMQPLPELDDMVQMWLEGYNTYHLVDGFAMKEAWGGIMPHIMLSEKNLDAILEQVKWSLSEDSLDGCLLTPRLRRVRFRGGAQEMITGYNTEHLESEFSVVSVR